METVNMTFITVNNIHTTIEDLLRVDNLDLCPKADIISIIE